MSPTGKMGRLLYFSFPAHGHINPTLAVFRQLARRSEVIYYGTEPFRQAVLETGVQFRSYGPQFRVPEHGPGPFGRVSTTLEELLRLICAVFEDCLEEIRAIAPTHIMHDSFAPWGPLIAQLLRLPAMASIPSILINAGIDRQYGRGIGASDPELTPEWYSDFRSRCRACLLMYGVREVLSPPELLQSYAARNLVYTSRLFQPMAEAFDARRFRFVGPCFDFRPQAPAFPFDQLDGRPLVFISLGTVYGDRPEFLRTCVEELSGAPWQIVLSTGEHFPFERLGAVPDNLIVRSFVPQTEILQRSAAFLTHGGMNSVQEALYFGVPLVMAPQGADQFWISSRVAELGAGLVVDSDGLKAAAIRGGIIRQSIEKVLCETGYRAAAARIGFSLRAAGGPRKAAAIIHDFLGGDPDP
jgi:MGT family glycosyltransferase